jgi:hypothetical protein
MSFLLSLFVGHIYAMNIGDEMVVENKIVNENTALIQKQAPDEAWILNMPEEVMLIFCLNLEKLKDIIALCSACKYSYKQPSTQFFRYLSELRMLVCEYPPLFNDDQEENLEQKLKEIKSLKKHIISCKKRIQEIEKAHLYDLNLSQALEQIFLKFMQNLDNSQKVPIKRQLRSLERHDIFLSRAENDLVIDIVDNLGIQKIYQEKASLCERIAHTIGRNKKVLICGTLTLGAICAVGTYYLMHYEPFDPQLFVSAYNSPDTGQGYNSFFYDGRELPYDIKSRHWCLPNGRKFWWPAPHKCDRENDGYKYIDPDRNPPRSTDGDIKTECNKTLQQAAAFLSERCKLNLDLWQHLFEKALNGSDLGDYAYYCNPNSNESLVCARFWGDKKQSYIENIQEISLAMVEKYYNQHYITKASIYGVLTGLLSFTFLGISLCSCLLG